MLLSLYLLYPAFPATGSDNSDAAYNRTLSRGIEAFYRADWRSADSLFVSLMEKREEDPRAYFFSSMIPFWEYFFGGNTEKAAREFLDRSGKAIEISRTRLKEHPRDTSMVLFLSGLYGYRGLVSASQKQYNTAIKNGLAAYQFTSKLMKLDMKDPNALIGKGIFNYMVGSIPEKMAWLINFAGLEADREVGLKMLEEVASSDSYVSNDAKMILTLLYQKEERYPEALNHIRSLRERYPDNIIFQYYFARLLEQCDKPAEAKEQYLLVLEMPDQPLAELKQESLNRIKKL